ncbi:MAG: N-acetylmuramoyl-L-alanine amidase, partial [Gemmatimonadota bacterium]|nr:N-acetylmuramoyl-L-alanine amidase [Gemmatimonadota bacterium]
EGYQYSPREAILTVSEKVAPGAQREVPAGGSDGPSAGSERPDGAAAPRTSAARTPAPAAPPVRVVVVDAGHGGADPGTISRSGVREKQVALGVALSLAAALRENPLYEVRMIRDDDTFVELWDRGELATEWAGDRHGILVSIHANSFPPRQAARGFETYVNAEARTEHERRVAAIENAPLTVSGYGMDPNEDPDLGSILRDLRTLDDQHWSVLLAEFIQEEVARVHPGPDRGVKQTPLAVLTNALMPSVLVEIGYLSNADEAVVLGRPAFQKDAGIAIARAVDRFFQRYPPGATDEVGPAR